MNGRKKSLFTKIRHRPFMSQQDSIPDTTANLLHANLDINLNQVRQALGNSTDLIIREFCIGQEEQIRASILYTDGLADSAKIQEFIMKVTMVEIKSVPIHIRHDDLLQKLKDCALIIADLKEVNSFETLYHALLSGDTVFLLDGYNRGFIASTKGWESRNVTEPVTETVIRGPQEGFTEKIRTNTALIRRKVKDPNLWLETRQIGRVTKTDVSIMFIKGIVKETVVDEVRQRLDKINIDSILESGYIEELIQDKTYTPFPTILNSERPDVVAAALLEGRVAILVDGTPFVLLVPAVFAQFFQSAEEYYQRSDFGLIRLLRLTCLFISLLLPSFYIAITTFHQEMLPTSLLINLMAQREGVPFPSLIEALLMETTLEILREAGVRMPRAVGHALSIVGALVIGQAAVEAGIVSSAQVIIVSLTAISGFVTPYFNMGISLRILRFLLMFLASVFGLFGIFVGVIAIVLHLCSLQSFGVPYMFPYAPFSLDEQKDMLLRLPWRMMRTRPRHTGERNRVRQQETSLSR